MGLTNTTCWTDVNNDDAVLKTVQLCNRGEHRPPCKGNRQDPCGRRKWGVPDVHVYILSPVANKSI